MSVPAVISTIGCLVQRHGGPSVLGHFDQLLTLPMVERHITLACVSNRVGGSLIGNAKWLGVPLRCCWKKLAFGMAATKWWADRWMNSKWASNVGCF